MMTNIKQNRQFMKCPAFSDAMTQSDQSKGITPPPFGRPPKGETVTLPPFENVVEIAKYDELLQTRRSQRNYQDTPMSQEQLAFMLWSVQGIQAFRGEVATFRPVPSGGARHPFETYIAVNNVEGLQQGLYRYHPIINPKERCCTIERYGEHPDDTHLTQMLAGQSWAVKASIVLFFTCVPYRAEWRYVEVAHRVMLIDLGHIGQNAMLSAVALGLGSCCMAAYDQKLCDATLGLDGLEEYTVYAVSVGKTRD